MVVHVDPWRALAREAVAGDAGAMRRLIEALAPSVLRLVRAVLGPRRADAEDVAQESLLGFVEALATFRGECTVLHYACRIAIRTAVAARRRAKARDERLANAGPPAVGADEDAGVPGDPRLAGCRRVLLRALLDELPAAQAETLALRVVLGCSLQEVADATGVPVNTVRSRMRLTKEALRRRIEADPDLLEMLEVAG